ncbi:hypothetical protein HU200_017409 [Digitaria exilis]|uniref:Uncharacterized protein n=1 Tax=Digitaria exilis TaxID=1010633 RepID=A0A835KH32_9POAL|nr:hypothetical protein HU200_017409 [Digitaria exilis]
MPRFVRRAPCTPRCSRRSVAIHASCCHQTMRLTLETGQEYDDRNGRFAVRPPPVRPPPESHGGLPPAIGPLPHPSLPIPPPHTPLPELLPSPRHPPPPPQLFRLRRRRVLFRLLRLEDYCLVSRLGLTRAQALKAATKIPHLRSSAKPESVLAYLESNLGIPVADLGRAVLVDPRFLCASVEKTLAPRIADLQASALRWHAGFFTVNLDKSARPNVAFLRQHGLNISDTTSASMYYPRLFTINPELLKEAVQRVEELGLDCGARMLRQALPLVALTDKDVLAKRIQLLHNIGCSKDDVLTIAKNQPSVLALREQKVKGNFDFLMKDVGLELSYIVRRPVLLKFSVERRLLPRHIVLKVLKEKGLLKFELDFYSTALLAEKDFVKKLVHPFKNHAPGIVEDYASKCLGKTTDGIA